MCTAYHDNYMLHTFHGVKFTPCALALWSVLWNA